MKKRYVVISSNLNDDYLFWVPLVTYAWNKLAWNVILLCSDYQKVSRFDYVKSQFFLFSKDNEIFQWSEGLFSYDEITICQVSRLYAASMVMEDPLILTSDCDMMPLSNYWKPKFGDISCYGRDLSDRHQPMCYVSMSGNNWINVMNLRGNFIADIERDLRDRHDVNSFDPEEKWVVDQNLLTERLKERLVVNIERGNHENGYPIGRIDRSSWSRSLNQKERIDCHLPKEGYIRINFNKVMEVIKDCLKPTEDEIKWMLDYRERYVQLMQTT